MSESALLQLSDAQTALSAALDARDVDALDAATAAVAAAVEEVRVAGGWREHAGLRDDLITVLKGAEDIRGRVNSLADGNRRKLDKLVSLAGTPRAISYGRSGKLS